MTCFNADARRFFLCGMRFFFGLWLLYAGLTKWIVFGPTGFVGHITGEFDKTWSPHALNLVLAWVILITEPALALWLLVGWRQRLAWAFITLLMFMLTIGQTILMSPNVIANWQYLVLTLVCAALSGPTDHKTAAA